MPRRDMWGEAITRGDSVGPDFVSPLYATKETDDPLRAEVAQLRVPVSMPQRDVMLDGERVPLTPEQYDEYQRVSGAAAGQSLRDAMRSPSWRAMTDVQRSDYIRAAFSDARRQGRGELLAMHPEIGAGVAPKVIPPLPPGYSAGSSAPAGLKGLRGPGAAVPPLPPGYSMAR